MKKKFMNLWKSVILLLLQTNNSLPAILNHTKFEFSSQTFLTKVKTDVVSCNYDRHDEEAFQSLFFFLKLLKKRVKVLQQVPTWLKPLSTLFPSESCSKNWLQVRSFCCFARIQLLFMFMLHAQAKTARSFWVSNLSAQWKSESKAWRIKNLPLSFIRVQRLSQSWLQDCQSTSTVPDSSFLICFCTQRAVWKGMIFILSPGSEHKRAELYALSCAIC